MELKANKKNDYYAKDNFWTKNFSTTASSNFLINFWTPFDASVIKLLEKGGKNLLRKAILDEFACGGTGLYANTGPIFNPFNSLHIIGGSSSGSAKVVAENLVSFSLGHDTGDSIRRPAAYCGVVGFKPSYGVVSRSGVIPLASSLDTVGIFGRKVKDVKLIFSIINQPDPADLTTQPKKFRSLQNK
ncbi:MAG: aspartyl/glutamyl-tRNA amidotransferase subunit A [Mycoplasmataceae bacterium RC_NB112A]|nr:MAG: aspartyl/glutamyl-tRNA amidotransferase subunit A [Mycoplasmataceae bacterium RC_NB112A]KLL01943.1 MAG: aspartyl/glutamyl-tRNA amidotransferase subunit A [Mycoplasmataceae bacterium RC_NB112A]